jgi:adenine-specific DNA-methyltransferase
MSITYLKSGEQTKVSDGTYIVTGDRDDGSVVAENSSVLNKIIPTTAWRIGSHDASRNGSNLLKAIMPDRKFPFPKSLYAVEDAIRFFVFDKPDSTILDFFAGSGTTTHAVMRLNRQDGGRRQCISITNNEVAADEQSALRKSGLRPGDSEWEKWGICDYITKARIEAVIAGKTLDGKDLVGDYKFTDEFPMVEGFEENAEFFTLTYETPVSVGHNRAFERIAALLWMRAGSKGRRIKKVPANGWELADSYGLLIDLETERTARKIYRSRDEAKADVFDYIERFYNPKRRHSTIGYMSPMEFERKAGLA